MIKRRKCNLFLMIALVAIFLFPTVFSGCFNNSGNENNGSDVGTLNEDETNRQKTLKDLFDKRFSDYGIDVDQARNMLYWSPNDEYIVFEGLKNIAQSEVKPAVVIADIKNDIILKIKDGAIKGVPTWSPDGKNVAVSFDDGTYIYNVESKQLKSMGFTTQMLCFSPDGSKIVYSNNGINVYDLIQDTSTKITDRKYDAAPVWFSDSQRIFMFRDNGRDLGGGQGNEQVMSIMDIANPQGFTDIILQKKGKFLDAKWLKEDNLIHVAMSIENGRDEYIVDLANAKIYEVGKIEGTAAGQGLFVSRSAEKVLKVKSQKLEFFDFNMRPLTSFVMNIDPTYPSAKDNTGYKLLKDGRAIFLNTNRAENQEALMLVDPVRNYIIRLSDYGEMSVPFVSNDGTKIAVIIEGKKLSLIDAEKATGEIVPAKLAFVSNSGMDDLNILFPSREGVKWVYTGISEYGHAIILESIKKDEATNTTEYVIKGENTDPAGKGTTEDNRISIKYTVSNNAVRETIIAGKRMPHKIKEFDIIRGPLEQGNVWIQTVNMDGVIKDMRAEIVEVVENDAGEKQIKIIYTVPWDIIPGGLYKEVRTFRQGRGLESFENTYDRETQFTYQLSYIQGFEN